MACYLMERRAGGGGEWDEGWGEGGGGVCKHDIVICIWSSQ